MRHHQMVRAAAAADSEFTRVIGLPLEEEMSAPFRDLAQGIQKIWESMGQDLQPLQVPEKFLSADVGGTADMGNFSLQNLFFTSRTHRKIHMELARGERGFEVLHVMMYPRVEFNLPLYAVDMVGFGGRVTLCIADLSPGREGPLDQLSENVMRQVAAKGLLDELPERKTPDWGKPIFSDYCGLVSPEAPEDVDKICAFALEILKAHMDSIQDLQPVVLEEEMRKNAEGQGRFCYYQLQNDKTRRLLENCMGQEWTDGYMSEVLFDTPSLP